MTFRELLEGAEILSQSGNPAIRRRIRFAAGEARLCFHRHAGETSDGNRFIEQLLLPERWQSSLILLLKSHEKDVAWAQVPHGRRALARLSANFYKRPAERIAITGVTGTNGKSTTAFLLEAILSAAAGKAL